MILNQSAILVRPSIIFTDQERIKHRKKIASSKLVPVFKTSQIFVEIVEIERLLIF